MDITAYQIVCKAETSPEKEKFADRLRLLIRDCIDFDIEAEHDDLSKNEAIVNAWAIALVVTPNHFVLRSLLLKLKAMMEEGRPKQHVSSHMLLRTIIAYRFFDVSP